MRYQRRVFYHKMASAGFHVLFNLGDQQSTIDKQLSGQLLEDITIVAY